MKVSEQILNDIATDLRDAIVHEIEADHLVYSGQLKNSWQVSKNDDGSVSVGSPLIWALVQDEGRLPGKMPPPKKLFPWVMERIDGRDEKEIMRISWAVARKIERDGIAPKHFIKRALYRIIHG